VTVTGLDVGREGDGVSFLSLGFPGATVQLLQHLTTENLADDLHRMAPDFVVLAFGTNEGFNDNLDIANYTAQYEQIVRRLMEVRPGVRIVIVGPPDAARPAGVCHASGVGQDCVSAAAQIAADPDSLIHALLVYVSSGPPTTAPRLEGLCGRYDHGSRRPRLPAGGAQARLRRSTPLIWRQLLLRVELNYR